MEQLDTLVKGGEGSRGGKVVGHTSSGNAIYSSDKDAFSEQVSRARSVHDDPKSTKEQKDKAKKFLDGAKEHDKGMKKAEESELQNAYAELGLEYIEKAGDDIRSMR
jgi:hypothetical protein